MPKRATITAVENGYIVRLYDPEASAAAGLNAGAKLAELVASALGRGGGPPVDLPEFMRQEQAGPSLKDIGPKVVAMFEAAPDKRELVFDRIEDALEAVARFYAPRKRRKS